jgi:(2Fe-2S) ferredoxin
MVVSCDRIPQTFDYTGTILALEYKSNGTIKALRLSHPLGGLSVKLDKSLRSQLPSNLVPGVIVHVSGYQKPGKYGLMKRTADQITLQSSSPLAIVPTPAPPVSPPAAASKPSTILVCGKSSCRKRGSAKICQAIQSAAAHGRDPSAVRIKEVGCMKQCKAGPHLVFMPDKARYSRVQPSDVPQLLSQHLGSDGSPPPALQPAI